MMEVLEVVRFGVLPGVDTSLVAGRAAAIAGWLSDQPGFVSRVLAGPDEAGRWTDVVRWRSAEDAHRAASGFGGAPEAGPFIALLDGATVEMQHLTIVAAS
jgi:hypothetical protein